MSEVKKSSKKSVDYTQGPLFSPFLKFGIAILISNLAQSFYNTADNIVIGKYSGDENALAAISSTSSLYSLLITAIICMSVGNMIVLARAHGEKDNKKISDILHTSVAFALVAGIAMSVIGQFVSMPILKLLNTKPELIDKAYEYISIIFWGLPFSFVSSYSDSALRSRGKGGISTAVIVSSGVLNVGLNILFVAGLGMSVSGVAIATVISQAFSAVTILVILSRDDPEIAFNPRKLGIKFAVLVEFLKIGLPNGIQSILASLSSLITTTTLNSLPIDSLRANAVARSATLILGYICSSFTVSAVSVVVAQNYGAKNFGRIIRIMLYSAMTFTAIMLVVTPIYLIFPSAVLSLFADAETENYGALIELGIPLVILNILVYFMTGLYYIFASTSRSLGHSMTPLLVSIGGTIFSVGWCLFVFPKIGTPMSYFIYPPITSLLNLLVIAGIVLFYLVRVRRECNTSSEAATADGELADGEV